MQSDPGSLPPTRSLYGPVSLSVECTPLFLGGTMVRLEREVALACPCPVPPVEVSLSLPEDMEIIHYPAIPSCTAMILRMREKMQKTVSHDAERCTVQTPPPGLFEGGRGHSQV